MAYKGFFKPKNVHKYKGDPTNIVYRSRWELVFMSTLDSHPDVIEWSSESVVIPYICPTDNRPHRYFVDFYVKKRNHSDGKIEEVIIEIKPKKQTEEPKIQTGKKPTKAYINEVFTWGKNTAKWEAAKEYARQRGWKFMILTEKDLGISF